MDDTKNEAFLHSVELSFRLYLEKGTSRSTAKLKPLHGFIANDLHERLGNGYDIHSQGYGDGQEKELIGRYQNKAADIAIFRNGVPLVGIAVKFVMQNYKQNAVNYFEGMLGETANVRSNGLPYFQIFITLDRLPYFGKSDGVLRHWEYINQHNLDKYVVLSQDNPDIFMHTPNKTLIFIVHSEENNEITTKARYFEFYRSHPHLCLTQEYFTPFGRGVIFNDYSLFMEKVYHSILAL